MATDFFERQSRARTNTTWLVALFIIAVIAMVGLAVGASVVALQWFRHDPNEWGQAGGNDPLQWQIPLAVGAGTLAIIVGGTFYKIVALRQGGGGGVAESLGGQRLYPNATDPDHRRLLNVVEEMAIASGTAVPPVFLLRDEEGINAFAAGYTPGDAVIGVTRGCVQSLTREQLQGVVAHEFSHILNGDMRMGIRLIGVLHGILLLGLLGQEMFRMFVYSGAAWHGSSSRSSRKKGEGGGVLVLMAVAVALVVIGAVGVFFGGLIRAAVSRQREYLADASAVQFTRNPGGLSGALKKIGGRARGSRLRNPHAPEASHLFFAKAVHEGFTGVMATHPPLEKRIRAIEPTWDGTFPREEPPVQKSQQAAVPAPSSRSAPVLSAGFPVPGFPVADFPVAGALLSQAPGNASAVAGDSLLAANIRQSISQIGAPGEQHQRQAAELLGRIPESLRSAIREPYEARAVVYALLLDRDAALRQQQIEALSGTAGPDIVQRTEAWFREIGKLDLAVRLPLIDLSLPALRSMTDSQFRIFDHSVRTLVAADKAMDLFEWTLSQVLMRHLRGEFEKTSQPPTHYYAIHRLGDACAVLLSTLAHAGHSEAESKKAFALAARLVAEANPEWLPKSECTLGRLDAAVRKLATLSARHRARIIDACAVCICADGKVTTAEAEMLRGIADLTDCPMPPFLTAPQVPLPAISTASSSD